MGLKRLHERKIVMQRLRVLTLALGICVVSREALAADGISIKFDNKSQFAIHHLFLSPVKENEWGPDQLGDKDEDVIEPGETFTLNQIAPNKYDVKIVDEDDDECVVAGVKIAANETVTLNDADLVGCQVASALEADADGE